MPLQFGNIGAQNVSDARLTSPALQDEQAQSSYATRHVGWTCHSCSRNRHTEGFLPEIPLDWPKTSYGQRVIQLLHGLPATCHILDNENCNVSELRTVWKAGLLFCGVTILLACRYSRRASLTFNFCN